MHPNHVANSIRKSIRQLTVDINNNPHEVNHRLEEFVSTMAELAERIDAEEKLK